MPNRTGQRCALLTRRQAAEFLGLKPQTLEVWAAKRTGPPFVRVGGVVRYRQSDLDEWIESRTVRHDTQPDPRCTMIG